MSFIDKIFNIDKRVDNKVEKRLKEIETKGLDYQQRKEYLSNIYTQPLDFSLKESLSIHKENRALEGDIISSGAYAGLKASTDSDEYLSAYAIVSWIYACTKVKSQALASLPLKVYDINRDGERIDITDNPLLNFLKTPNFYQTKYEFFEKLQSYIELTGEGFISFYPNKQKPQKMYVLRSDYVRVFPDADKFITKYQYIANRKIVDYTTDEILYIKSFNPLSEFRGLSQLSSATNSIILELDSIAYMKGTFDNGGYFSGAYKFPPGVSNDDKDRIEKMARDKYAGASKANQMMFLYGGTDFTPFSLSAKDMEFLEQRQYSLKEILAIYNIPPLAVGIFESMSYANADVQMRLLWENLKPEAFKISDAFNRFILDPLLKRNVECEFDFSGIEALKENETEKINRLLQLKREGIISANEVRSELGRDPDPSPLMDAYWISFGVTPIMPGQQQLSNVQEQIPQEESIPLKQYIYQKSFTDKDNEIIIKGILDNRKLLMNQKSFQGKIQNLLEKQKQEVAKKLLDEVKKDYSFSSIKILGTGMVLFDMDKWVEEFYKAGYPHIALAIKQASENMINTLPTSVEYIQGKRVLDEIQNRSQLYSNELLQTNSEQLRLIVEDLKTQIESNMSIDDLGKMINERLDGLYGVQTEYRANLIARTEIVSATNFGNVEGMKQSNIKGIKKRWITSRDKDVREAHKIDGQVREIDEEFVLSDGRKMMYPSDFNERCTTIPVID